MPFKVIYDKIGSEAKVKYELNNDSVYSYNVIIDQLLVTFMRKNVYK